MQSVTRCISGSQYIFFTSSEGAGGHPGGRPGEPGGPGDGLAWISCHAGGSMGNGTSSEDIVPSSTTKSFLILVQK